MERISPSEANDEVTDEKHSGSWLAVAGGIGRYSRIAEIKLQAHFVTTIRVPGPVNSVVVGDPALFRVEHSEHEPELVFAKALTNEPAESNLLISTTRGRQISFLLVTRGGGCTNSSKVDFLLRYQPSGGFLVEPDASRSLW